MADLFAPVKVETIPLLSPTMELELMREPWSFPREPASYAIVNPVTNQPQEQQQTTHLTQQQLNVNATTPLSAWEENFQDLSGWCIAGIQARCDFPVGESIMASKLTDTKNEGNSDVLIVDDGATRDLMKTNNNHNNNLGGTSDGVDLPPQHDHAYTLVDHQQHHHHQQQNMYFNNTINTNSKSRAINTWMNSKDIKPETNASNNVWQELTDLGIIAIPSGNSTTATITTAPIYQPKATSDELKMKPDVFQSIETDAPSNFDLLSYLIDEDIPSPNDSISTNSSRVTDIISMPSTNLPAHIVVSPRTYEPIAISAPNTPSDALKARLQTVDSPLPHESPKHSPHSSTSSEVTAPTRHSYRQLRNIIKIEKPDSPPTPVERRSMRPRRSRTISSTSSFSGSSRGRKRTLDESEDDDEEDEGYREVREKNNEASRKSRMNKKAKEMEMARRSVELEKDNRILKMKVEELEKLVNSMRNALLRSALKRDVKTTNMF
ncbi:probable serine/threonine-protein kinase ndrC isoform X2 [Phymastichus coffea]|nr:probable serine/threonine-protein kinase ndrC isoform X2 [Phymastichus coffea]